MSVRRYRKCSKCYTVLVRVFALDDDTALVEYKSGRRGDPMKALMEGKIRYVGSPTRTIWRRLTEVTEVECTGCRCSETISPALEIEKATGIKPQPPMTKADQTELANRIAQAIVFVHSHPEVLANDPNYSPPPLDYSALASAIEQVANAKPHGVYFFPK